MSRVSLSVMLILVAVVALGSFQLMVSAAPTITLNPSLGLAGIQVEVSGSGFQVGDSGNTCKIQFGDSTLSSPNGACAILGTGAATGGFIVPNESPGFYIVSVTGNVNGIYESAYETFTITNSSDASSNVVVPGFLDPNIIVSAQTSAYSITFNPPNWFCNQWQSVNFQGPIVESGIAGHSLSFLFVQQSSPAGGYQSNIFLTISKRFFADSVTFNIDPALWHNVSFSSMPDIIVQVIDASTISQSNPAPPSLVTYDAGNIIAVPCPTSVTTSSTTGSTVQTVTVTSTDTPEFPTGVLTLFAAFIVALFAIHQKGISMRVHNSKSLEIGRIE